MEVNDGVTNESEKPPPKFNNGYGEIGAVFTGMLRGETGNYRSMNYTGKLFRIGDRYMIKNSVDGLEIIFENERSLTKYLAENNGMIFLMKDSETFQKGSREIMDFIVGYGKALSYHLKPIALLTNNVKRFRF